MFERALYFIISMPISNAEGRIERDVLFPILEAEVFRRELDGIGRLIGVHIDL